ncbi:Putative glucarate dehydratase [Verticillium dahliae VDG1]|nr:Putative glucarate dehydratase [Verticillium dahliae VDG1]
MDFETESLVSQPSQEGLILQKRPRHSIISDVPSFRFSREPSLSLNWTKPLPQIPPADMTLSGKIVLVAGGARGIGAAVALRLAQDGARIAFTPGMVKDGDEDGASEDLGLETARGTPAGERLGNVDDIADVVAFLVSEGARWVTGAVVPVNGGRMMF